MGNILGEPIKGQIQKQIEVRQKYYGDNKSSIDDPAENEKLRNLRIQLNQQRSPFIRLSSSVNIDDENVLLKAGIPAGYKNNVLAKSLVLFNGSSLWNNSKFIQRGGLNRSTSTFRVGDDTLGAYGLGGVGEENVLTDFGQVPMPGIKDIQVQYKNRGSLRQASISLTAYNITQFNAIDLLYLRLGYTVLLEWGNNVYINNDEELETQKTPTYYKKFIDGGLDYYQMLAEIETARVSSQGNYDAMIGKITNFNWNFTKEGNYEITINLVSIGDVIESIKVNSISYNVVGSSYENKLKSLQAEVRNLEEKAILHRQAARYYGGYQYTGGLLDAQRYEEITGYKTAINVQIDFTIDASGNFIPAEESNFSRPLYLQTDDPAGLEQYSEELDQYYENIKEFAKNIDATPESPLGDARKRLQDFLDSNVDEGLSSKAYLEASSVLSNIGSVLNSDISYYEAASQFLVRKSGDTLSRSGNNYPIDYARIRFSGVNEGSEDQDGLFDKEYYVRLGTLLQYLQEYVCFVYVQDGKGTPALTFDIDQNTNLIPINASTFPSDPRICIFDTGEFTFYGQGYNLYTGTDKSTGGASNLLSTFIKEVETEPVSYVGRLMNLYINVKYILKKVNSGYKEEGGVSLFDLLRYICDGINKNLGGLNKLEPVIDDTTNIVYLIDQSPIAKETLDKLGYTQNFDPNKTATFQIYGLNPLINGEYEGSFVKDFNIKTEISPKLATQLSIGAQAIGASIAENATGLQWFNQGIIDRISPKKVDDIDIDKEAEELGITQTLSAKLLGQKDLTWAILENVEDRTVTPSQMNQLISLNKTFQNLLSTEISAQTKSPTPQGTGFIPINLSLTMDGLSGIKIYNTFGVNSKFLPPNYGSNLLFIATKLNHKVDSSGWETTLDSLVIPSSVGNQNAESLIQKGDGTTPKPKHTDTETDLHIVGDDYTYYSGKESQFRKIVPTSIILHITVSNHTAKRTVESVNKVDKYADKENPYFTNGIHWAVDRTGGTFAGIPEGKHSAHGNNWNDHSIGIEISSYGYVVPITLDDGTIEYATYYDERANSKRDPGDRSTIPESQVIQLKNKDGKPWYWMGHGYFQEYTDVQIATLKTLIQGILSRHDGKKKIAETGEISAPIKDGIKGSVWSVFGMTERPQAARDYNRSALSIPPNKADGKSWDQLGIFTHTTAATTDHTDPIPTPKLINMLLSLGYTDTDPSY